jgi:small subunit ribosomal protein S17
MNEMDPSPVSSPLDPPDPPEHRVLGTVPDGSSPLGPTEGTVTGKKAGRNEPRIVQGLVTSAKMQKTISVEKESFEKDPKYGKYVRQNIRFKVHDEKGEAKEGDVVKIAQTRPLSKTKRWRLLEVVSRAKR